MTGYETEALNETALWFRVMDERRFFIAALSNAFVDP
mgnify:CR=1 FL=1